MKNKLKIIGYVHLIAMLFLYLGCTGIEPTNTDDSLYPGDYQISVDFDNLSNFGDTLEIFNPYKIHFEQVGADTFSTVAVLDENGKELNGVASFNYSSADTAITVYFAAPYSGKITVKATAPNGKSVSVTSNSPLTVITPYEISADTVQGENSENTLSIIKNFNAGNTPDSLYSIWKFKATTDTVFGLNFLYTTTNEDYSFNAKIMDRYKNVIDLGSRPVVVSGKAPVLDSVTSISVFELGKVVSFTINVPDSIGKFKVFATLNSKELFDTGSVFYTENRPDGFRF